MHCKSQLPVIATTLLLLASAPLSAQISPELQNATVSITQPSSDTTVTGTVWLSMPGQATLAQLVSAIYDPAAPQYHKFLNLQTLAPYLPTAAQVRATQAELTSHNIDVTASDPNNLSVTFQGKIKDIEAAFQTTVEMHTLSNGRTIVAFTTAPQLGGGAAGLIQTVTGVGQSPEEPEIVRPTDPATGKPLGVETLQQASSEANSSAPTYCILPPEPVTLTTPDQPLPASGYFGPVYGVPLTGGKLTPTNYCAYTPARFYAQTGLDKIHAAGYTGKGQTIAILEEGGSSTLATDLVAFDKTYSLPAADMNIINLGTPPTTPDEETTLDVESAHAVAPDAKIVVIDDEDLQGGLAYVIGHQLAKVVSISYGSRERLVSKEYIEQWNSELEAASSLGISVNVSSGDYGDDIALEGVSDVNVPADSPYATGVGGLAIFEVPGTNILYKTSWGNNLTLIGFDGAPNSSPEPVPHGQGKFGGGGGLSSIFSLPAYQAALGGAFRHTPDVSDLADGRTGLKIVYSDPQCTTTPCSEVAGGTSLAAPIFSAKWVLLNELHGSSLGQAAPLIAQYAHTPAVEDIVPLPGAAVVGASHTSSGVQTYSGDDLARPETSQPYISALWQPEKKETDGAAPGSDYVLTFGTDSSLAVTPGYDSATGWGQLNIWAIFSGLVPSLSHK